MAHNRYYIIEAKATNLDNILDKCVGDKESQRYSLDKTKLVLKLCEGDHNKYPELDKYQEYDHDKILQVLNNKEWTYD